MATPVPPRLVTRSAVSSMVSGRLYSERVEPLVRPVQRTVAPASPRAAAMPRPAPRVAPATTATRPRSDVGSGVQGIAGFCHRRRGARPPSRGIVRDVAGRSDVERVTRIELAFSAWEADVLPLNYTRGTGQLTRPRGHAPEPGRDTTPGVSRGRVS